MGKAVNYKKMRQLYRKEFDRALTKMGRWPFRDRVRIAWRILRGNPKILFRK